MTRRALLPLLCLLALASPALAQAPHDPARLFPHQAPVDVGGHRGLVRLPLPPAVLERTQPDLSDLRLHDGEGAAIPFLVDSGARPLASRPAHARYAVTPLEVERRVEEGESLRPTWRERLVIAPPGEVPEGARWTLSVGSTRATFVRRVTVRRLDADGAETLATATVFRLQEPLRERLSVELPAFEPAADTRLEVALAGEGGYVEPTLELEATRGPVEPPTLRRPLVPEARAAREGRSVIEVPRPPGLVPDRIRFATDTGSLFRRVRVLDLAQGRAPREIGRGAIFRVRAIEGAERLEVDVERARGERLRIEITDGDSPPLADLSLSAIVRQPTLVFEAGGLDPTLRFGGGRAHRPRYDVQRFAGTRLGDRILSAEHPEARLGPIEPNPRFDDGPALAFAMRPGRPADRTRFTHVAPVAVEGAREGLSRLTLPPAVLAVARPDLADVRVVGADGRQWPYLRAPHPTHASIEARVSEPEVGDRRSTYTLAPPVERARVDRLILHTEAPYVSRPYVLRGVDDAGRTVELARGRLERRPDEAGPLEVALEPTRVARLELEVEDGSDAPLEWTGVELSAPSRPLFLAAPDGDYELLAGDPDATAPSYEIARATDLVLAARAAEATVGEPRPNPAHVEPSWLEAADWRTWLLWGLLLLAVLVLGGLTIRLARHESSPEDDGGDAAEDGGEPGDGGEPAEDTEPAAETDAKGEGESTKPVSF